MAVTLSSHLITVPCVFTTSLLRCAGIDRMPSILSYSEEGHLFCEECVLKYLITKKNEYDVQMDDYLNAMRELEVCLNVYRRIFIL